LLASSSVSNDDLILGCDGGTTIHIKKAVLEVRRGRRLVTLDPSSSQPACEMATPTLSALEWALKPEKLALPEAALAKMHELAEAAPQPSQRLRAAAKRRVK
jgi:hypothetical protein